MDAPIYYIHPDSSKNAYYSNNHHHHHILSPSNPLADRDPFTSSSIDPDLSVQVSKDGPSSAPTNSGLHAGPSITKRHQSNPAPRKSGPGRHKLRGGDDEARRLLHIQTEKNRRTLMNNVYELLERELPPLSTCRVTKRPPKHNILQRALEYIKTLKSSHVQLSQNLARAKMGLPPAPLAPPHAATLAIITPPGLPTPHQTPGPLAYRDAMNDYFNPKSANFLLSSAQVMSSSFLPTTSLIPPVVIPSEPCSSAPPPCSTTGGSSNLLESAFIPQSFYSNSNSSSSMFTS